MVEHPIVGFPAIAEALRTSPRQVLVWATRKRDPLRLRTYQGLPRILPSKLKAWQDRHNEKAGMKVVRGWQKIAMRVEMSRMAAVRASEVEDDPLPVHHPQHGLMVWAHESALDDWKEAHELPYAAHRRLRGGRWQPGAEGCNGHAGTD